MATGAIKNLQAIATGTLSVASGWSGADRSWLKKTGNVVDCYLELTGGTLSSGWNTIATLPSGYRPVSYFDSLQVDNGQDSYAFTKVLASGEIRLYKLTNTSNNFRGHFTFIAAN